MPNVPGRSAARAALDLGHEETVIVIVGRLVPVKRPLLAVGAAVLVPAPGVRDRRRAERARLEATFPQARLLGALPRPPRSHLDRRAGSADLGLRERGRADRDPGGAAARACRW
jgi:hypothetical protein